MMKILITVCFVLLATGCPLCHAQSSGVELEVEVEPASEAAIKIFHLENADATECVSQLKELDQTTKIVADPRTNSVIVRSSDESQLRILEALLLRLDESPSKKKTLPADAEISGVTVFRLQNSDVHEAAMMLQILDGISEFKSDSSKNELTVVATKDRMERIQNFLERLDKKSTPTKPESGPSGKSHNGSAKPDSDSNIRSPLNISPTIDVSDHPEALRLLKLLSEKESTAGALAAKIRTGEQTPDVDPQAIVDYRKSLVAVLREALDLKFQLEKLQLAALEERIASIKSRLTKRTSPKSIEQIVGRREQELIYGDNSRWTPKELGSADADNRSPNLSQEKSPLTPVPESVGAVRDSQRDNRTAGSTETLSSRPIESYHELASKLAEVNREANAHEAQLKQLTEKSEGSAASGLLQTVKERVKSANLKRKWIQEEYAATLKDLEVQVASAKSDVETIKRQKERIEKLKLNQAATQSEVDDVRDMFKRAQFSLERLQIRLDLYQKAGESVQAGLDGSITEVKQTGPPVQPKAVEEESSDANPENFVRDGFPGKAATTTPKVPETYEQCAEILRTSTNVDQLRAAITTITKLRNSGRAPTEQENSSLASSILIYMAEDNTKHASKMGDVLTMWRELDISVKFAAILKLLRGTNESEKLVAVNYAGPVIDFLDQPEFPKFCEELLKLGAAPNVELRVAALRALAKTLPITKLNSADFKSAERQEMVSRMKTFVPRQKVMELMGNSMSEQDVERALFFAYLVGEYSESIDDQNVITKAIEVLFQIAQGQFANSTTSYNQRSSALIRLRRFHSRPKEIVPKLMELLKSDKSDLNIAGPGDLDAPRNSSSREAIIIALVAFGQNAKDALPLLEDELTLVKVKGNAGNARKFLELAIQKISGPPLGGMRMD